MGLGLEFFQLSMSFRQECFGVHFGLALGDGDDGPGRDAEAEAPHGSGDRPGLVEDCK